MTPAHDDVQRIADIARKQGLHVAVAESLTGGALASRLAAGPGAAEWFRGGVVAYGEQVKFDLLGVTPGPLVTERCARQLAEGVAGLLGAEAAVGATGVGGPDPSEGKPPGSVILAVTVEGMVECRSFEFPGGPEDVIAATVDQALRMLAETLQSSLPGPQGTSH